MKKIQSEFSRLIKNSSSSEAKQLRSVLLDAFTKGLAAVMPEKLIDGTVFVNGTQLTISSRYSSQHAKYDLLNFSKVLIIGAGKATGGLAEALIKKIGPVIPCYGSINIPKGQEEKWGESIKFVSDSGIISEVGLVYASHPIPDNNGIKGSKKIMELVSKAEPDVLVMIVISGGGSVLMPLPSRPITISSLKDLNEVLLESGANIVEINAIRKHVSDIKGGRLAAAIHPRTAVSLILSDVKGDLIDAIASGPTTFDTSSFASAWQIIEKYRIVHVVPESIRVVLRKGVNGLLQETPKQNHPAFAKMTNFIIGSAATAISEMKDSLISQGFRETGSVSPIELVGEAKEVGKNLADLLRSIEPNKIPITRVMVINSGECTVTITGEGVGGRNQEMLLSLIQELATKPEVKVRFSIVSMAFDGIEGNSPAAGAVLDNESLARVKEKKLDYSKFLEENNSYAFFKELGDSIETGQTGTNVNDIYCILIEKN
jgi:glycerate-2-kinase